MSLNGTLEDFSPAGILKVLSADGRTGAVRFGGPAGCTVYLHRGQIYFARNAGTDEALATALVRPGRLTADDWGRAIDGAGDRPMVGELLVRAGAIAPDLLASVVLSVVYDPLIELFRDGTGEFDFEADTVHWLGPFRAFPADAIINEVRKRVREVDEWSATFPALDVWVEASRTLPGNAAQVTLLREDWELVTALAGPRTISELAGELGRGTYSTARVVNRLSQSGLVEIIAGGSAEADVVPLRRTEAAPAPELEADPLLAMGLPHRTARLDEPRHPAGDSLSARIDETIADALSAPAPAPAASPASAPLPDHSPFTAPTDPATGSGAPADAPIEASSLGGPAPAPSPAAAPVGAPAPTLDHSWDEARTAGITDPIHHGLLEPTSLDEARPADPNAAWLADLYSQFIDTTEDAPKKRRKGDINPVDVAFKTEEQDAEAKVSTLKRLMGALKKL
jgi:hypothetical protein